MKRYDGILISAMSLFVDNKMFMFVVNMRRQHSREQRFFVVMIKMSDKNHG